MAIRSQPAPRPFELIAGSVALDLANTLEDRFKESGPQELLVSYDHLLRFATQAELLSERQARKLKRAAADSPAMREQTLNQVRELREAVAVVGYAQVDGKEPPASALAVLERYFQQAGSRRRLRRRLISDPSRLQLSWSWRGLDSQIEAPLWLLAQAAADLLLSSHAAHLRCCSSDTCRWLFLDTSKNHTRGWCEMKTCGNRMKARRFQARQAANP
jgi:predicted RNA-binding Zn ribbon-like protein